MPVLYSMKSQAGNGQQQGRKIFRPCYVAEIINRLHDFKYHAADEKNRWLAFLTRRLAIKNQVVDF
jgi:hypothetical protein